MAHLYCNDHCWDCIDKQIVLALRIKDVLSDPHNCEEERQRLADLLRERERLTEQFEKMGKEA